MFTIELTPASWVGPTRNTGKFLIQRRNGSHGWSHDAVSIPTDMQYVLLHTRAYYIFIKELWPTSLPRLIPGQSLNIAPKS